MEPVRGIRPFLKILSCGSLKINIEYSKFKFELFYCQNLINLCIMRKLGENLSYLIVQRSKSETEKEIVSGICSE